MSATMRQIRFAFTVEKDERWTAEHRAQCEGDDPDSYDDWVTEQIESAMHAAGEKFIAEHPDLFRGGLT